MAEQENLIPIEDLTVHQNPESNEIPHSVSSSALALATKVEGLLLASKKKQLRRQFKFIFEHIQDAEQAKDFIDILQKQLLEKDIQFTPFFSKHTSHKRIISFSLQSQQNSKSAKPSVFPSFTKEQHFDLPDDFMKYLFDFGSEQEYERFQACLDSNTPVGIFLIPMKEDFYSEVLERILSFEITRKRQYQGDFRIGDISHLDLSRFTESDSGNNNESFNVWNSADIFHFNHITMLNVILGQSATELIESERFEKKFNQLSLYGNKYYSGQFFILFHCPSWAQIVKNNRQDILDKLIAQVSKKFPHVFKLTSLYQQESQIDFRVKNLIFKHFRIYTEVPSYQANPELSLIEYLSELQKVHLQAENQILLKIKPAYFNKLSWRYETDEYVFLQYFAVKTLKERYHYKLKDILVDVNDTREVENDEYSTHVDVKAKNEVMVAIETLIRKANDKNPYLSLVKSLREESEAWSSDLKELWIVVTGFEASRNFYQLMKTQEILLETFQGKFQPGFNIRIMVPDYLQHELVPMGIEQVRKPSLSIKRIQQHLQSVNIVKEENLLTFDKVKGLYEEKEILRDLIRLQTENHSLGLGGILFYGLPGCGKTYLTNAFSNELKRNFFSFSPADIQSVWIGQSQKNIKDIFSQAKSKSPSILFLDELDSIGFSRDEPHAHTEQKATLNQLLIEMNNVDENDTLVVGATNRVNALDTALKRSGRFDLKIPIFPPNVQERSDIFEFYISQLNKELIAKNRMPIELDKVYFNYIGEEGIGLTSSDIKAIVNKLRIDNLLNKPNASDKNELIKKIKKFIQEGQRTLRKEDVVQFIEDCLANDHDSPKIDFLRVEWNI